MEYVMLIFWLALVVVLIIIEALTAPLLTIWFAVGAAAALVGAICGLQLWLQWVIFIAVSVIALIAARPFVKKITKKSAQPTNADRVIGQTAVVTEEINNVESRGQVNVNGAVWSARSEDGSVFRKDECVTVEKIDGVKLIVKAQK